MQQITILYPGRIVVGDNALLTFARDFTTLSLKRLFLVTTIHLLEQIQEAIELLKSSGIEVLIDSSTEKEPDMKDFRIILDRARSFKADSVVGIGGGSVMDVAKLVSALLYSEQDARDVFGIGKLAGRSVFLSCIPSTAGTGSEVSPNAIILDEDTNLKQGIVSPHLVPDSAYVDPQLTCSVPPSVTAATGLDALTHCLEAYTNINAHPVIDLFALEGVRLISKHLKKAVDDGNNKESRSAVALGSFYGGLCLGPVNTTAVHALSYPLGSTFHIPHGLSNAVLLPHVMEFNLVAAPDRFADVAVALGSEKAATPHDTALNGVTLVRKLMRDCRVPENLSEMGIPESALEEMALSAIKVTRLLKNNVRKVTFEDAFIIYKNAF